ncbi:MAG: hypothetical protein NE327_21950 [Lentisphaeraceae bacterium]|nr:hypothetical protein [Lentisphaeraceae bacterium]
MSEFKSVSEARQRYKQLETKIDLITKYEFEDKPKKKENDGLWGSTVGKVVNQFKTKIELNKLDKLKKELKKSEDYLLNAETTSLDKEMFDETNWDDSEESAKNH